MADTAVDLKCNQVVHMATTAGHHIAEPYKKTEICNAWLEFDSCPHGSKCTFAHGFYEVRERLDRCKNAVLCIPFEQDGMCQYGRRCRFLHVDPFSITGHVPCIHKSHLQQEQLNTSSSDDAMMDCPEGDSFEALPIGGQLRPLSLQSVPEGVETSPSASCVEKAPSHVFVTASDIWSLLGAALIE